MKFSENVGHREMFNDRRFSKIGSSNPDPNEYPLFYDALCKEVVLDEGNFLIIPAGWHHLVYSDGVNKQTNVNMAISYWINDEFDEVAAFERQAYDMNIEFSSNIAYEDYANAVLVSKPLISNSSYFEIPITHEVLQKAIISSSILVSDKPEIPSTTLRHLYDIDIFPNVNVVDFLRNNLRYKSKYVYLHNLKIDQEIINVFRPSFLLSKKLNTTQCWINHGNVRTFLHYDTEHNILLQLQGRKRVFLFPPNERSKLYMHNPYPIRLLYSMSFHDHSSQQFHFNLSPQTCIKLIKDYGHNENVSLKEPDCEALKDRLYVAFREYMKVLYSVEKFTIETVPGDISFYKRKRSIEDDFSIKMNVSDILSASPIKSMGFRVDTLQKVFCTRYHFYWFLNTIADGNMCNFLYKTCFLPKPRQGSLLIIPTCHLFEHVLTIPESEDAFIIHGILYQSIE